MANTYGWAIDLSITKINKDKQDHLISINLSMPGGNKDAGWLEAEKPLECVGKFEYWEDALKKLMKPWDWGVINWELYEINDGVFTKLEVDLKQLIKKEKTSENKKYKNLIDKINRSLDDIGLNQTILDSGQSKAFWKPFDLENTEKGKTLVHAIAPLSYLPEDISSYLNMTFTGVIQRSFESGRKYVVFPSFKLDSDILELTINTINESDTYASGDYNATEQGFNIKFYCNVESQIANNKPTLTLKKQETDPAIWKANVLGFISPVSLLVKSVLSQQTSLFTFYVDDNQKKEALKNQIKSLTLYLFRSIGAGWGLSYEDDSKRKKTNTATTKYFDNLLNVFIDEDKKIDFSKVQFPEEPYLSGEPVFLDTEQSFVSFIKKLEDYKNVNDTDIKQIIDYCANLYGQLKEDKEPNQKPLLAIMAQLQNQEVLKKVSVLCWFVHNSSQFQPTQIIDNLEKIIKDGISQDVIDQAQFALLVESPYVQYANIAENIRNSELPNCNELGIALFRLLFGRNEELEKQLIHSILQEASLLISANEEASKAYVKPKDDGLKFSFEGDGNQGEDEKYRGYAIALQVSKKQNEWDKASSAWITDVQIGLTEYKTIISEFLHETIGATETNGSAVGSFEYTGNPLVASKVTVQDNKYVFVNKSDYKDEDGTDYIDYVWPITVEAQPPKLGYGLWYRGIATPLGNAGEVFHESLWESSNPTKLIEASEAIIKVTNHEQPVQYLSCVPPSAPTVIFDAESLTKLQELSEETKAYVYQASVSKSNKPLPVALLCNDGKTFINEKSTSTFTLRFHKPIPNIDFLEKWNNGEDSSTINLQEFKSKLENFTKLKNKDYSSLSSKPADSRVVEIENVINSVCLHPAVKEVLISVQINGGTNCLKVLEIQKLTALIIEKTSQDLFDENALKIKLNAGSFCKVGFFSLIKEELFTGTNKKFNYVAFDNSFKNDNAEVTNKIEIEGKKYRQFGPAEYWFEAAPTYIEIKTELAPEVNSKEKESLVELSIASNLDATWIRGVEFQRHEWHWTGYPVTFPNVKSEFDEWLSSFVGVESYREEDNYVLNSYIDGNSWKIGDKKSQSVVVQQHQLASGPRPARYIAFSVRPKIRFSKWVKPDAQVRKNIESKVFANGTLAKGNPIDVLQERIPLPPLKWAIPLTATYKKPDNNDSPLPERTQNGNLLIFDEAFRRTDSLVRFGGIGDTIDIEVMGTRERDIHEFGVNPIFHGYETLADQTLICDEPFGLTYDITRNAKVAQTGLVVSPKLADGKWMLAKVRARRLIHPDTIHSKEQNNENGKFQLPTRKVGDHIIPADFYLKNSGESLDIFGESIKITKNKNLFVTFHNFKKNLPADNGKITFNLDIQIVEENETKLNGALSKASSKIEQLENIEIEKLSGNSLDINAINENAKLMLLLVSDYTDPIWLSFIGSFGAEAKKLDSTKCKITKNTDALIFKSDIEWINEKEEIINLVQTFKKYDDSTDSRFHVLMVYEPVQDIYKTGRELDGGRFIGFYVFNAINENGANFLKTANATDIKDISSDAYAYLITIQKATAISSSDKNELSSKLDLMKFLFPEPKHEDEMVKLVESKIRITPEYLGPIKINVNIG